MGVRTFLRQPDLDVVVSCTNELMISYGPTGLPPISRLTAGIMTKATTGARMDNLNGQLRRPGQKSSERAGVGDVGMGGRAIAERRLAAIKPLLDEPLRTRAMAQAVAAAQGVHVATIYEWLRTYEGAGHLAALMPRQSGTTAGVRRVDDTVEAIITSVIEDEYLSKPKKKPARVIEEVTRRCHAAGTRPPHPNTVRRRIQNLAAAPMPLGSVGVLPLPALDERIAIVGTSGSGKTYAAKGLIETLVDQAARVCVVDPLGVWWGLRAGADGSNPGHPVVVFGGRHADIALNEDMGAALGRLVGTHQLACVVDLSGFGSGAARRSFMTAFSEALYEANTEPLHLVLDEADLWAPQRAQPGGQALLGRVEEIVRRGRVRGFVPWLITQRPAVLHKDVLSQADILVSMKLTSSQDREAVGRWIEGQADRAEGRRILAELPRLARGEGWVWAPSDGVLARVTFPRIRTFDSSSTPQRHECIAMPGALAQVNLSALTAALAEMMNAYEVSERPGPASGGREQVSELERRLRKQDRRLEAVWARLAEMEAMTAAMRTRLETIESRDELTAPVAHDPEQSAAKS